MKQTNDLPDPRLIAMLESLRVTEPRDPNLAAAQRTAFQLQAKEIVQAYLRNQSLV